MEKKVAIQVIILGDGAIGKTSMIKQYTKSEFDEDHITTLGLDFATKKYTAKDGKEISAKIWDTAGQEDYDRLRPLSDPQTVSTGIIVEQKRTKWQRRAKGQFYEMHLTYFDDP